MSFRIRALTPDDPPDAFPDPGSMGTALGYPDGMIAVGGDLSVPRLVAAYQRGIFPWFNDDQPILWWSPDPRAVLLPAELHVSRRLAKELRQGHWRYTVNECFGAVIEGCASNRGRHGTWITPEMMQAYCRLHQLGYAHSVEAWLDGELAGGVYGIRLDHVFFGESMYSARTNGSKVALTALARLSVRNGISLIDCQVASEHLATLGMREIPRRDFLEKIEGLGAEPTPLEDTYLGPYPGRELVS